MAEDNLKPGAAVEFHRSHDMHTKLSGVIKEVKGKGKDREVLIETEPSKTLVVANAALVTVTEKAPERRVPVHNPPAAGEDGEGEDPAPAA